METLELSLRLSPPSHIPNQLQTELSLRLSPPLSPISNQLQTKLSFRLSPSSPIPNQLQTKTEAIRLTTTTTIQHSNNEAVQSNRPNNEEVQSNEKQVQSNNKRKRTKADNSNRPNNEEVQSNQKRKRTKADNSPIEPPYPWSTQQRGVVHELEYLRSEGIVKIAGDVRCKRCERSYEMEYDLAEKFEEIRRFIEINKGSLHDRAPNCWNSPVLPDCKMCKQEKCVEPVIPQDDNDDNFSRINWLFLLLGQMLGRLKLKQLKYFCNHTSIHRTGAKNRLLYLTYLALCNQLQPSNSLFSHR